MPIHMRILPQVLHMLESEISSLPWCSFFISVKGVIFFSIFDSKKYSFIGIDTDPDSAKWCGFDTIRAGSWSTTLVGTYKAYWFVFEKQEKNEKYDKTSVYS